MADHYKDLTVSYADVESVEYREGVDAGSRVNGYGSSRLLMGSFKNDAFGYYTRYTYTDCDTFVLLTVKGKTVVLSGADEEATREIYDTPVEKTA